MYDAFLFYLFVQKIFADERFQTDGNEETMEHQFSVQFLNAVTATSSQSDEAQIETMKVCYIFFQMKLICKYIALGNFIMKMYNLE